MSLASTTSAFPVFDPASPHAAAMRDLFVQVLVISAVIFAIMGTLIVVAAVRFRAKGTRDPIPVQEHGSERREIAWMVVPVFVVIWLAAASAHLILMINAHASADPPPESAAAESAELVVVGHQWWWEVRYPATVWSPYGDGPDVVAANEIHIPTGRRLRVRLESADVAHSFWVPQLARKLDAIPGRIGHLWLQADAAGEYQGFCAEFCGTQHAWMRFVVVAQPQAAFDAWLNGQRRSQAPATPGGADPSTLVAAGEQLFRTMACVDCHAYGTLGTRAAIGPDLTDVSRRTTLGGGVIANGPGDLERWLENPQAIKPGCKMPNFNLTAEHVSALSAFLRSGAPTAASNAGDPTAAPAAPSAGTPAPATPSPPTPAPTTPGGSP